MNSGRDLEQRSPVTNEVATASCAEGGDKALMRIGGGGGPAIGCRAASSTAAAIAVATTILG